MTKVELVSILAAVLIASGCSDESGTACVPGSTQACVCPGGAAGGQVCADDGSRWETCVCGGADADADADADGDVGEDADGDGDGDGNQPPTVTCMTAPVRFPGQLQATANARDADGDRIDSFSWRLASRPDGSTVPFTDSGGTIVTLDPDVPGWYEFCVTVVAGGLESSESCCRTSAPDHLEWAFNAAGSRLSPSEIALWGCGLNLLLDTNQMLEWDPTPSEFVISNPAWSAAGGWGGGGWFVSYIAGRVSSSSGDHTAITPGDVVSFNGRVRRATLTGETGVPINLTAVIVADSVGDPNGPSIREVLSEPLFAGLGQRLCVRFEEGRLVGERVFVGTCPYVPALAYTAAGVADDGLGQDDLAGDGWYCGEWSGTWLHVGSYHVVLRAESSNDTGRLVGPFHTTTLVVR